MCIYIKEPRSDPERAKILSIGSSSPSLLDARCAHVYVYDGYIHTYIRAAREKRVRERERERERSNLVPAFIYEKAIRARAPRSCKYVSADSYFARVIDLYAPARVRARASAAFFPPPCFALTPPFCPLLPLSSSVRAWLSLSHFFASLVRHRRGASSRMRCCCNKVLD